MSPLNVLVADDSDLVRERLVGMLSEIEGLGVILQAANGLEARDIILAETPELAVLDLRMPGRSGLNVLRDIKASNPATKIVILTNYPYPQYRSRCMEEGADFFFDKSSEFEKVTEVISQLLQDSNQ